MIHIEASSVEAAVSSTLPVAAVWLATALAPAIVLIVCLGLAPAFGPPRRSRSSVASAKQPDSEVLKVVESATAAAAVATAAPFQRASEVAETASAVQRLLEDDRYLVAEPLLQRLQATAVSGGAPARASARALSQLPASLPAATVLQRCVEARAALASICGAAGWRLVASTERESPAVPRSSTFLKREAGLMWSKTVAQLAVPAVDACAVVRESQLFKTYPCCVESERLAEVGRAEGLFRVEQRYEFPLVPVALREDIVLHGFLEHGGLLVCGRSPKQSEWADVRFPPKPPGRYSHFLGRYSWRTDVTALQFFVEPCGGAGCKMTLQLGVDDPGDACPNWLVDALMKRVIARLFSAREPSTMSELCEAEDDEESDLILPPRFARRIWLVSWLALSSGSAAIANGRRDCAALSVLMLATSLNYWRRPTHGPRRTVDMAAAAGSLIYQVAAVAPFSHCPIAAGAYLASVAAGAGCYARARLLSRRHGDRDSSSWWHVGLHLCGNAGNVLLYDAVGRNLVGWRRR
ncbi:hypothetical protein EMIHUDRAFT_103249 [Emiliania huxleyi CCMP1516]|uniref:Uncharacterized protein n=2 Tax=Emiliania huxleyi TaxID=2903 RepID=A0A0D3IWW5_EMIH1|nr:hypothetical protein EMIHUDRAFT_103249 [Emiliania huxleyi CCMP1516]EOD15750.1 hypothetical protein EMIHUDRAFT_103249 [Emiliania huxleyi CCMP1516]|eukprot:XP_005768179.1 hypothetical protein EMIHUDRAFT_103249 [Emiliania huxleyi CCMP1516]